MYMYSVVTTNFYKRGVFKTQNGKMTEWPLTIRNTVNSYNIIIIES